MHIKFQYPIDDNYIWFLQVEADCSIDHSSQWQETVIQLVSVRLQNVMSIRIPEMPEDLVNGIIDKAITEYEKAQTKVGRQIYYEL